MTDVPTIENATAYVDGAPDAILGVGPDGSVVMANRQAGQLFGYQQNELVGMSLEALVPEDARHIHPAHRTRYAAAPAPRAMGDTRSRVMARHASGQLLPVEIALAAVVIDGSQHLMAVVRDIANQLAIENERDIVRRAAEQRFSANEEAFRSAFDDAPVPMAMADLSDPNDRPIVRANRAFGNLLGIDPSSLVGVPVAELTHPDDLAEDVAGAATLISEGLNYTTEKRYRRTDGSYVWGELHAAMVKGPEGRPTSLAHIVDISRRVAAEKDRDRREQLLTLLASIRSQALQEVPLERVLAFIAESTKATLSACHCLLATPDDGDLLCRAMDSDIVPNRTGLALPPGAIAAQVVSSGEPLLVGDLSRHRDVLTEPPQIVAQLGPALFIPLMSSDSLEGVLVVARAIGEPEFDDHDVETTTALANEAAITIVLDRARQDRRRMALTEDRERIARDLHDVVIQRLFASGMKLQSALDAPDRLRVRAQDTITDLDETIAVIRKTIFHLTQPDVTIAGDIERVIARHRAVGRNHLVVDVDGDLETVPHLLAEQLARGLNEILTSVQQYANADKAEVVIQWDGQVLAVTVVDNGVTMTAGDRREFALGGLVRRTEQLGGSVTFGPGPEGIGTIVRWSLLTPR